MNCSECRLALHAHLDDELEVVNARTVEEHLGSCAACTAESAALRALGERLRAHAERPEPPVGFEARLRASLRASLQDDAVDGAPPAARPVRRMRLVPFVPLAAAGLPLPRFP